MTQLRVLAPDRSYADRVELLGLLAARHPYPPGVPDQRAGILLQTKWQDRSGRAITDESGRLRSWWPTANWTLTVWQLEALQRRGEFSEVSLAEPSLPLPDEVAASILAYFDRLDEITAARHPEIQSQIQSQISDAYELQRLLWAFHVRAIAEGLTAGLPLVAALPAAEVPFAEAWGRCMVGLLAAVNFPTEFETVRGMQRLLPSRLLRPEDWDLDAPSDLAEPQRRTLIAMRALHDSERASDGALERRLATVATSPPAARAAANHLFETLAFGGPFAAKFLRARIGG